MAKQFADLEDRLKAAEDALVEQRDKAAEDLQELREELEEEKEDVITELFEGADVKSFWWEEPYHSTWGSVSAAMLTWKNMGFAGATIGIQALLPRSVPAWFWTFFYGGKTSLAVMEPFYRNGITYIPRRFVPAFMANMKPPGQWFMERLHFEQYYMIKSAAAIGCQALKCASRIAMGLVVAGVAYKALTWWCGAPMIRHEYTLNLADADDERDTDLRPDAQAVGDVKHERPREVNVGYHKQFLLSGLAPTGQVNMLWANSIDYRQQLRQRLGLAAWPLRETRLISAELVSQLLNPNNLSMIANDEIFARRVDMTARTLNSIHLNRMNPLLKRYVIQNSQLFAYAVYRDMMRKSGKLPFPPAPTPTVATPVYPGAA